MQAYATAEAHAQRVPWALLDELRRITVEQLAPLPDTLYPQIEADLDRALKAATERGLGLGGAQRDELMLLKLLRQRSASLSMRFREQLGRLFDPLSGQYRDDDEDMGLRLVGEEELDFRLTGERMAELVAGQHKPLVDAIDRRIASLAQTLGRPGAANPVTPQALAGAFVQTFRDTDLSPVLQTLLVSQYRAALSDALPALYARIQSLLGSDAPEHGFVVDTVERRQPPPAPAPEAAPAATPVATSAAPPNAQRHDPGAASWRGPGNADAATGPLQQGDWFRVSPDAAARHAELRGLLHAWRDGGTPPAGAAQAHAGPARAPMPARHGAPSPGHGGPPASVPTVETEALGRVAGLLQADIYEPFEQALAGRQRLHEAIREHMGDAARRLGIDLEHASVSRSDADAIDLVGMLFESLATEQATSAEARHLFARLVMTYVRIALRDDQLFQRPGHPGKRLIDAVALSVEDNEGVSRQERELLECAQLQVERVVAEFNEDLAVLETATNELQGLLQQQRRNAELAERRSRESAQGRERLRLARNRAATEVAQRISGRALTPAVARFLSHYWRHHYELALLRGGADSPKVAEADRLADALVELDALATLPRGGDVAERMLSLMPRLTQCLSDSGLDHGAADEWLARIARAIAFPDQPRTTQTLTATPAEADAADQRGVDPTLIARMSMLRTGDVMRLAEPDGTLQMVKVAWISDSSPRLLMVDRRGQRKLLASPQQLALLAAQGRLHFGGDELPFDRALREVQARLGGA